MAASAAVGGAAAGAAAAGAANVTGKGAALAVGAHALTAAPAALGLAEQFVVGDLGAAPAALLADKALLVAAFATSGNLGARVGWVRSGELRVATVRDVGARADAGQERVDLHLSAAARLGALTLEVLHARHLPFQKLVSARWWWVPGARYASGMATLDAMIREGQCPDRAHGDRPPLGQGTPPARHRRRRWSCRSG
jgi:hypothetical protein